MKNKTIFIALGVFALVLIVAGVLASGPAPVDEKTQPDKVAGAQDGKMQVMLYKSPTCGCCGAYASYLKSSDYSVTIQEEADMTAIKEQFGIPLDLQSCHTSIIDGYVVEGHMPEAAIVKLLAEQPEIAGIALPGMPSGSPGMPGPKAEPFTIYAFSADGQVTEFMSL